MCVSASSCLSLLGRSQCRGRCLTSLLPLTHPAFSYALLYTFRAFGGECQRHEGIADPHKSGFEWALNGEFSVEIYYSITILEYRKGHPYRKADAW